jgi:hypothetical protein
MAKQHISRSEAFSIMSRGSWKDGRWVWAYFTDERLFKLGVKTQNYFGKKIVIKSFNEAVLLQYDFRLNAQTAIGKDKNGFYLRKLS